MPASVPPSQPNRKRRCAGPVRSDDRNAARIESTAGIYLALSRHLDTLRYRHNHANVFDQDDAKVKRLFDLPTRLPFWCVGLASG